jgi:hypothetical protein
MKFRGLIRSPRKRKQVVGYFDAERFARLEVVDNSNLVLQFLPCVADESIYTRGRMSVQRRGDICSAVIDRDLFGHVLSNFRQQLARAKRFRHIVIAAGHSRLLSFTAERIRRDCDDRD